MLRRWWLLPVVLLTLVGGWAACVRLSGRAYLPRHTSARDLPYALRAPDVLDQPFNRAMTDPMNLILPDLVLLKRELANGRIPIWNHDLLCGVPHAANPIAGALYPPNLLVAFFDPLDFLLVSACVHLLLAGLFFHLFLLATGVRPFAALVGALGFALSGWMAAHLHNTPLAAVVSWIPLGLAGTEWILRGRRRVGTLAIAVSVAMQWLAGFPLFAVIGTLTLGVYAVVSLVAGAGAPTIKGRAGAGGRVLLAVVLGVMFAAVQILPTLDVRDRAPRRGAERPVLLAEAFEPGVLSGAALPFWLGDAHEKPITEAPVEEDRDHAARHVLASLLLGARSGSEPLKVSRINTFGERTLYAGAPILLLAVCGLVAARRAALALLAAALLASLFALGFLPPDPVLRVLGLNVGAPGRAILVIALTMPAMAAFGLDRLLHPDGGRSRAAWATLRISGFLLGFLGALAALASFVAHDASLNAAVRFLRAAGAPDALGVTVDRPDSDYARDLSPAFDRLRLDMLRLSLFVLATWAALEWARRAMRKEGVNGPSVRWKDGPMIATLLVPVFVIADLGSFFLRTNQPVQRAGLFPSTPAIEFLQKEGGKGRFARVSADDAAAMGDVDTLMVPNIGMIHDLTDAQGYRDLVPSRILRLLDGTSAKVGTGGATGVGLGAAGSPVLDLVSARWLIASRALPETGEAFQRSGLKRVDIAGDPGRDVVVYENPDARPLAYVVHDAVVMNDDDGLEALRKGAFDVTKRVALDRLPPEARTGDPGSAQDEIVTARFECDTIRVDATLASPGFVVVGESWDPGWRATLWHGPWQEDRGDELEIARANVAFMAVWVPKGVHTIEFRYWPRALSFGIGLCATAALTLLATLVWPIRRRPAPEGPPET